MLINLFLDLTSHSVALELSQTEYFHNLIICSDQDLNSWPQTQKPGWDFNHSAIGPPDIQTQISIRPIPLWHFISKYIWIYIPLTSHISYTKVMLFTLVILHCLFSPLCPVDNPISSCIYLSKYDAILSMLIILLDERTTFIYTCNSDNPCHIFQQSGTSQVTSDNLVSTYPRMM